MSATLKDIYRLKNDFWGEYHEPAPSSHTRRLMVLEILKNAYAINQQNFTFVVGNREKNNRVVCEIGFLILLGLMRSNRSADIPSQWRRVKEYVISGCNEPYKCNKNNIGLESRGCPKYDNAYSFIVHFTKEFGDTLPTPQGTF